MRFAVAMIAAVALPARAGAGEALVERGRYLVEDVAHCTECHTPRDEEGNLDRERWLEGGRPVHATPSWASEAPALAGLPGGYTEERLVAFLTTGRKPNGGKPRPPMKSYRLETGDARAIAAYLASLEPPVE